MTTSNLLVMETEWANAKEPHERIRWARLNAGYSTASAAAESLGMKKDTYSAYEREPGMSKSTGLDHQSAIRFARKFKVSWTWLLVGEGTPFQSNLNEQQQRVVRAMADMPEQDQQRAADVIEALRKAG